MPEFGLGLALSLLDLKSIPALSLQFIYFTPRRLLTYWLLKLKEQHLLSAHVHISFCFFH
jgi:hypothetical protein